MGSSIRFFILVRHFIVAMPCSRNWLRFPGTPHRAEQFVNYSLERSAAPLVFNLPSDIPFTSGGTSLDRSVQLAAGIRIFDRR